MSSGNKTKDLPPAPPGHHYDIAEVRAKMARRKAEAEFNCIHRDDAEKTRKAQELANRVAEVRAEMARRKVEAETKRIIELQRQEVVAAQVLDFVGVNPLARLVAAYTEAHESEKRIGDA